MPSLVLSRQGNRTPEHQAATPLANLTEVTADLDTGMIVIVTNDSIPIRRIPVSN